TRVSTIFTLNISNVNDAPVLSTIGALTAMEGVAFSKQLSATDDDSDSITYDDDTGLFDISSTGLISFTPTFKDSGTYPIRITVNDGNGGSDYEDITLTVLETNIAPNITAYVPSTASVTMLEDNSTTFNVTASDSDGTTPSIKWYLNDVLVKTGSTYTFIGNFTFAGTNAGTYTVKAVVSDGLLTDTQTWTLQVNRTRDSDSDLMPDYKDNCVLVYNPDQTDLDPGTPEGLVCENNKDGDNVLDEDDFIDGTADNLDTNVNNVELKIENSSDLDRVINETQPVVLSYKEYDLETGVETEKELVNFNFSFNSSSTLDLSSLSVRTQDEDAEQGAIVVSGLDLSSQGTTKTVYVKDIDNTKNSVCVKDAIIASVTEISGTCNGANETKLPCTSSGHSRTVNEGTVNERTYICTDLGDSYMIEGLVHSGVQENLCSASWSCSSWGDCVGETQSCTGTWTDANDCGSSYSGSNSRSCTSTGGGSSSSSTETEYIPKKSGVWTIVLAGETKFFSVKSNMMIDLVEFRLLVSKENVKIVVRQVSTPIVSKEGKIYKYFEIEKENFENFDLEFANIEFKVEKNWFETNGVFAENIALFRYDSGWEELSTSKTGEDDVYIYYVSITTGFSTFAIGEKGVVVDVREPVVEPVDEEDTIIPTGEVVKEESEEQIVVREPQERIKTISKSMFLIILIVLVIYSLILITSGRTRMNSNGLIDSHLRKADKNRKKADIERKKAYDYNRKGDKSRAAKHNSKAITYESKVEYYRKQAQKHHDLKHLKKAMDLHKKGEAFYHSGDYEKSKKYYTLAQKYRNKAKQKLS
ncbi:MAG: PGF-pre-PGF domain-containing protein, partial [Nanoarchaeota archaeon]|nr:PGF-pre-PGF domain-containing protein [Nanoarchaeota archaeon]MBU1854359.1 PGF-pre-PGF domain-containing protein [Nanoarchaeota archaeon]